MRRVVSTKCSSVKLNQLFVSSGYSSAGDRSGQEASHTQKDGIIFLQIGLFAIKFTANPFFFFSKHCMTCKIQ